MTHRVIGNASVGRPHNHNETHSESADERQAIGERLAVAAIACCVALGVQIMSPHLLSQPEQPVVKPKAHWFRGPATPDGKAA